LTPMDSQYDAPLLRLAWQFKEQAAAREMAATNQLVQAWGVAWRKLSAQLADLTKLIQAEEAAGRGATIGQDWRRQRYMDLLRQIEAELKDLLPYADETIRRAQEKELEAALKEGPSITRAALGMPDEMAPGVMAGWNRLSVNAVTHLVGTLQTGSPLRSLLDQLGTQTSKGMQEHLISGLAAGRNPVAIARVIRADFGMSLSRAMRISRTEILRAYRGANLYQYQANPHIISGWRWVASLSADGRTCIACLLQHGKVYPTTTPMASHVSCRCTPAPVTRSWRDLGFDIKEPIPAIQPGDGWRWFEKQPEKLQVQVLGRPMYHAWKQGLVTPDQMWYVHRDATWGDSIVASSVRRAMTQPVQH
jgi:SPP1 gp7 family putative phage head morphogenesis protein